MNDIADVRDGTHDSPKYVQEGHPFITSKNVSNGCINYDDVQYVTDEDYEEINKRSKVDMHDILMGMIGTIGNLALIREKPDFAIKNVALIKYTGDVDYQFLYQALQTGYVTNQLSAGMDGGTQKFMSLKKIRELDIPYPEVPEQEKKIPEPEENILQEKEVTEPSGIVNIRTEELEDSNIVVSKEEIEMAELEAKKAHEEALVKAEEARAIVEEARRKAEEAARILAEIEKKHANNLHEGQALTTDMPEEEKPEEMQLHLKIGNNN